MCAVINNKCIVHNWVTCWYLVGSLQGEMLYSAVSTRIVQGNVPNPRV